MNDYISYISTYSNCLYEDGDGIHILCKSASKKSRHGKHEMHINVNPVSDQVNASENNPRCCLMDPRS